MRAALLDRAPLDRAGADQRGGLVPPLPVTQVYAASTVVAESIVTSEASAVTGVLCRPPASKHV